MRVNATRCSDLRLLAPPRAAITALASIITLTPGTLSAELSEDRRHLLVHGFNLRDPAATVAGIKARYEAPLQEIFR